MKKDSSEQIEIREIASGGNGIGRLSDELIVFVPGTVPGDIISGRIVKKKKQYAEAELLEIIHPSPYRRSPLCQHFETCGGCKWQMIQYQKQIEYKEKLVRNAFIHIGRFDKELSISPIIAGQQEFHYRNKMEFSFGHSAEGKLTLGLHCPGSWENVFDVSECLLTQDFTNQLVELVRSESIRLDIPPYHNYFHQGTLRFLVVRTGIHTGENLVSLITTGENPEQVDQLLQKIAEYLPDGSSLLHGISNRKAAIATSDQFRVIRGAQQIQEKLDDITYYLGPNTFFQSNTLQAEILFRYAKEMAVLKPSYRVLELYSGTGAISLSMAAEVRQITGIELVAESVESANQNKLRNGISNCEFLCGNVSALIPQFEKTPFDLVIIDPPRPGVSPGTIQILKKIQAEKILYISCNPDTLARDAAMLTCDGYYSVSRIQPIDMFPQTPHIECICLFEPTR